MRFLVCTEIFPTRFVTTATSDSDTATCRLKISLTFISFCDFIPRTFFRPARLAHFQRQKPYRAKRHSSTRLDPAMSGALTAFATLFRQSSSEPSVAAAVVVLADNPPPNRLGAALMAVAPHLAADNRAAWVAALAGPLLKAGITTPRCVAAFLGQCAVESAGFRSMEEDLSYSAARLCVVWPTRFPTVEAAEACALQPEVLANRVYANRLGNGDEASGDGWRFRGRGLIQVTGRAAYQRFARAMNLSLDQ